MSVKVVYSTEAFLHRNHGHEGTSSDPYLPFFSFASVEEAKSAPLPDGSAFAFIQVEDGFYTYSKTLGWEFHNNP